MNENHHNKLNDNTNNKNSSGPRIVTMDSIRNNQDSERQAYFAGGSETSGQQILGRGRRGADDSHNPRDSSEALAAAFRRAASGSLNDAGEASSSLSLQSGRHLFGGVGHRLGDTESPELQVQSPQQDNENPAQVVLTLWENGYTLDNGPILSYDDPRCAELMANINRGELPTNLIPYGRAGPVHLAVVDKRGQKYKESLKVFGGKGHKLGSPTPAVSATQGGSSGSSVCSNDGLPTSLHDPSTQDSASTHHFNNTVDSLVVMRKRRAKPLNYDEDAVGIEEDVIYEDEENSSASDDVLLVGSDHQDRSFQGQGHLLHTPSDGSSNHVFQDGASGLVNSTFDMSDEGAKTTTLKIRLPNGKSIQLTVNATNSVHQLRECIRLCIPFLAEVEFSLQLSYPKRDLQDEEICDSKDINNSLLTLTI